MKNSKQIFEQVKKQVIEENLGYVDLQPINNLEATPKTDFEKKFAEFLSEEIKEENVKVDSKKVAKSVEEIESHNFDYKDVKNLDNQIGQEVLNGIYFEAKQNPDKSLEEIREIVSKNLAKDGQHYMNNAMFGIDGLKAETMKNEEVSGKHAASGYSDKVKEVVKESLGGIVTSGHPNSFSSLQNAVVTQMMAEKEENVTEEEETPKPKKAKKAKKESIDTKLAEIGKEAEAVKLEAQLDFLHDHIAEKLERVNSINEDENLKELIDKAKMKQMQKEIKELEKKKAKMEKIYEKSCGKKYQKEEIVDEMEVNEVEVEEVSLDHE